MALASVKKESWLRRWLSSYVLAVGTVADNMTNEIVLIHVLTPHVQQLYVVSSPDPAFSERGWVWGRDYSYPAL